MHTRDVALALHLAGFLLTGPRLDTAGTEQFSESSKPDMEVLTDQSSRNEVTNRGSSYCGVTLICR